MMPSLNQIAAALGGKVRGRQVIAPGPGHASPHDESLSVKINDAGDDLVVNSIAGDDPIECKDYIRGKLGMPAWHPRRGNGNGRSFDDDIDAELAGNSEPAPAAKPPLPIPLRTTAKRHVCDYNYRDLDGKLAYQVQRF